MAGLDDNVDYLSTKELETAISTQYGKQEIEDLLDVEAKLKAYKRNIEDKRERVFEEMYNDYGASPSFPYGNPRDYQQQALEEQQTKGAFCNGYRYRQNTNCPKLSFENLQEIQFLQSSNTRPNDNPRRPMGTGVQEVSF